MQNEHESATGIRPAAMTRLTSVAFHGTCWRCVPRYTLQLSPERVHVGKLSRLGSRLRLKEALGLVGDVSWRIAVRAHRRRRCRASMWSKLRLVQRVVLILLLEQGRERRV